MKLYRRMALAALKRYVLILAVMLLFVTGTRYVVGATVTPFTGATCAEASQLLNCLNQVITAYNPLVSNGYQKVVPLTGFSSYFGNTQNNFININPAGTLAAGDFYLSAAPVDGANDCFFTTQQISSTSVYGLGTQTVNNALSKTSIAANTRVCYLYGAANTTWDRN